MATSSIAKLVASSIQITGLVQGVGMRPAIARLATRLSLNGFVRNDSVGVQVHIQGSDAAVEKFHELMTSSIPARARIDVINSQIAEVCEYSSFEVVERLESGSPSFTQSDKETSPLATVVPVDRVTCQKCLNEVNDKSNRRFQYPFTSCVDCGPRYSIIERMPFERADSSMSVFQLCHECQQENRNETDSRFHCQTNGCSVCGPVVWARNDRNETIAKGIDAIREAANAIREQKVVAIRGLGGYQLLADATSEKTVAKLLGAKTGTASRSRFLLDLSEKLFAWQV